MTKCEKCNREFPGHLIQQMFSSEGVFNCCPLCALKIRNEMHGLPIDTPFHGTIANELWQEANEYVNKK